MNEMFEKCAEHHMTIGDVLAPEPPLNFTPSNTLYQVILIGHSVNIQWMSSGSCKLGTASGLFIHGVIFQQQKGTIIFLKNPPHPIIKS